MGSWLQKMSQLRRKAGWLDMLGMLAGCAGFDIGLDITAHTYLVPS